MHSGKPIGRDSVLPEVVRAELAADARFYVAIAADLSRFCVPQRPRRRRTLARPLRAALAAVAVILWLGTLGASDRASWPPQAPAVMAPR